MKKIKIRVHSFIDIITNSSTEIYVSATDKTVECVYELLNKFLIANKSAYSASDVFNVILKNNFHGHELYYEDFGYDSREELISNFIDNGSYTTDVIIEVNAGYEEYKDVVESVKMLIVTFVGEEFCID